MSDSNIDKAATFVRGVAVGNPDLATEYVDKAKYIEHDPRVADGVAGLKEHIGGLPKAGLGLTVIRALEDRALAVVQTRGDVLGQNDFFDVFRFDGELIAEHWAFSAKGAPPNKSGHTQTDGPTVPKHLEDTEKNKAIVRDYYETVHLAGRHDQARRWFAGDLCIRHEPGVADGVAPFLRDLEILTRNRTIDEIKIFAGQGDLVFLVAEGSVEGKPCAYVDLYRVEDEKIVEHWGFPEPFPPSEEQRNANGML